MKVNRNAAFGLYVVLFMVFWNLLDFLYAVLIARSGYRFTLTADGTVPVGMALVSGYLFFLRNGNDDSTENKDE